jgi:hypothetical protein
MLMLAGVARMLLNYAKNLLCDPKWQVVTPAVCDTNFVRNCGGNLLVN